MHKKQIILISSAAILLILLVIFGKTVNPNKKVVEPIQEQNIQHFKFEKVLQNSKESLSQAHKALLLKIEKNAETHSGTEKIHALNHLANFWRDSARYYEPYLFYISEAAKLENSEKSLTFAAQQFTSSLLEVSEPSVQSWLATNAKVLFDKALSINPNNDSSIIGLGACYILGNISTNPMEGILPLKEIVTKNPANIYAQLILGLGGKKSGQFDKAIERFLLIVEKQPTNIEAILHLAECYEQKHDKLNAKIWYLKASSLINNEVIKKEIENRINELK